MKYFNLYISAIWVGSSMLWFTHLPSVGYVYLSVGCMYYALHFLEIEK